MPHACFYSCLLMPHACFTVSAGHSREGVQYSCMFRHHPHRHRPASDEPPRNPELADVVERNICSLIQLREEAEQNKSLQDRIADAITAFSGSMVFVYLHVAWFIIWVVINLGWTRWKPFDPFPFGLL